MEFENLSIQNKTPQLQCQVQSDQLELRHEVAMKSTLDTDHRYPEFLSKSTASIEDKILPKIYDVMEKELDTRICTEVSDSTATNSASLSKTTVISDLHIVDDNLTIPGCHSDLQSNCHCVVHVMQVEPQREASSNLSLTPRIDDKESNNREILSPLRC